MGQLLTKHKVGPFTLTHLINVKHYLTRTLLSQQVMLSYQTMNMRTQLSRLKVKILFLELHNPIKIPTQVGEK